MYAGYPRVRLSSRDNLGIMKDDRAYSRHILGQLRLMMPLIRKVSRGKKEGNQQGQGRDRKMHKGEGTTKIQTYSRRSMTAQIYLIIAGQAFVITQGET